MKQVLSLLTAFVFLQMQTWALSGGPVFANQASPNVTGVYSGVMFPKDVKTGDAVNGTKRDPAGTNGVFTVTVTNGISNGTLVFFVNGGLYTGSIQGVADPDRRTFDGILQAAAAYGVEIAPAFYAVVNGQLTLVPAIVESPDATGSMHLDIIEDFSRPQAGRANTSVGNAARLKGKAKLDVFTDTNANQMPITIVQATYNVSGFRATTTALP